MKTPPPAANQEPQILEVLRSQTMINSVVNELEFYWRNPDALQYPKYDIQVLDDLTNGIPLAYWVLVAPQKFGKSFIMQHISNQTEKCGKRNLNVSLEMDNFMMGCRILAKETEIPLSQISRASFTQEEWDRIVEAQKRIQEWNGLWNYSARRLPDLIKIIEVVDPDYIFFDYLGLASTGRHTTRRSEEITQLSQELKALTKPQRVMDQKRMNFEMTLTLVDQHRWLIGDGNADTVIQKMQQYWERYQKKVSEDPSAVENQIIRRRGLYTASQTSKEQQRSGNLDVTAPKDSQAPFEDCDFGLIGNFILGADGKPLPNVRNLTVAVSRISAGGDEVEIGINPSLGHVWDYKNGGSRPKQSNITDQFGRPINK